MDIFLTFLFSFFVWTTAAAQSDSALRFEETTFDFGNISEEGGSVAHSFTFVNSGSAPVVIVSATSTCGCTVPSFSRKPVMAGEKGVVEISYDPMNRPGSFDKRVTVVTSEKDATPVRLYVRGNVLPRKKGVEEEFPIYIGNGLRAETNFHSFSYVEQGKAVRTGVGLVNTSDKTLHIDINNDSRSKIYKVAPSSLVLKAGERGDITIAGDVAAGSSTYGTVTETIVFDIDGRRSDATLVVTGVVIDNRDDHPDNFAPKAEINKNIVKFGVVKRNGGEHTMWLELFNSGEAPLTVRAVEGCAEGTSVSLKAGDCIAAGERRRVGITVRPHQKGYGPLVERIRIITDDPLRPMRDIKITMIVEE